MTINGLIEEYLTKAKEAEDHASRTHDRTLKESWQRIALSYREMAQRQLDGGSPVPKTGQQKPLPAWEANPSSND